MEMAAHIEKSRKSLPGSIRASLKNTELDPYAVPTLATWRQGAEVGLFIWAALIACCQLIATNSIHLHGTDVALSIQQVQALMGRWLTIPWVLTFAVGGAILFPLTKVTLSIGVFLGSVLLAVGHGIMLFCFPNLDTEARRFADRASIQFSFDSLIGQGRTEVVQSHLHPSLQAYYLSKIDAIHSMSAYSDRNTKLVNLMVEARSIIEHRNETAPGGE